MNRSRWVFLIIVGAAILLVGGSILLDRLEQQPSSSGNTSGRETNNTAPITLTAAVSPIAADWIENAARTYNSARHRVDGRVVEVRVTRQDSLPVWTSPSVWSGRDHPAIWIPELTQSVEYANEVGMDFAVRQPSIASTVMMWGLPSERAQVLAARFGQIDWHSVQQASVEADWAAIGGQTDWRFVTPGFAQPDRYMSGVAAMLIATAEFHDQSELDAALLNDRALINWLRPVFESVPSFASLGVHPAKEIATRGTSLADVALLPESEWLASYRALTARVGALTLTYPTYQVWFDFPFAVWDGADMSQAERTAANDFLTFLLSDAQQQRAAAFGLRNAEGMPADRTLFEAAQDAGVSASRPVGTSIQLPTRSDLTPFVNRNWTAF